MRRWTALCIMALFLSYCTGRPTADIRVPGIVDGDILTLKSTVSGQIEALLFQEGKRVARDEILLKINSDKVDNQIRELQIGMEEIDVNIKKLEKRQAWVAANTRHLANQVERFRRLRDKKAIPGENLESMELKLLEAQTNRFDTQQSLRSLHLQKQKLENKIEYSRLILKDHTIQSPVDGTVVERLVSRGESVFPNTPLADLLDTASLHVEIFIEEREMAMLKIGQEAQILVDGLESDQPKGRITYFGQKAEFSPKYVISEKERKSLLYLVKISVDAHSGVLKVGMPVTVILKKSNK